MTESPRLTKFLADQEAAVQIARDQSATPFDYNIRADAINTALSLASAMRDARSVGMAELVADAKIAEAYLRGASHG